MFTDTFASKWNKFRNDACGNVAMMFGLTIIPLVFFAGAAIDYSRLTAEKAKFQAAIDAAALSITGAPDSVSVSELQTRAENYFAAAYGVASYGAGINITVTKADQIITIHGTTLVDMTIMKVAGYDKMPVSATTKVTAGRKKIEIALVLDNTGSMGSAGKIEALKASVSDLIDGLKQKVVNPDDVKLSIVPFNTEVKVDPGYFNAAWLRWDVTLANPSLSTWDQQPPLPADWTGCLADREQPYDISSEPANAPATRYVAAKCHATGLAQMAPLTTNLEDIRTRANSMTPNGATNIAIGYTMGLATLRKDSPFGANAGKGANVEKFMIVLTDGDNTRNRWSDDVATIDTRLSSACARARTDATDKKVKIYTIRVVNGNAALLKSCASDPGKFFDVSSASQLQPVFKKILESIQAVRITS
ncbi:MAG: VWA domain-containing protein [Hyphomicrobiales bacterium]|nr:VWA domain-containing protein [Hyphomicrobiales bacterium]